jgi:DNA-binding NarL/FixJ family response regulator
VTEPIRVLIVDEHPALRYGVIAFLREDPGIAVVGEAGSGEEAITPVRTTAPPPANLRSDHPRTQRGPRR